MTPASVPTPPVQPPAPPSGTVAPALPAGPRPYRWTIAAYRKLGRTGLFDGLRTMLLRGEIFVVPNPNPPHNLSLGLAEDWLRAVFATGHHVRNQMGFDIGTEDDPGPDLAVVVGGRRDYATRQASAAVLVVEVADSSLLTDTTTKAESYATAGVPDYWVIDLVNRQLLVFRDPQPLPAGLGATAYRTHLTLGPADTVAPLAAPQATVTVADLLP
jgi:Uma2 family endonuclease